MTTETLYSTGRALLAAIGTFLVGHTIAGHQVDSNLWMLVTGSVMAILSFGLAIASKDTTAEKVQSAARAAWASTGGLLMAIGVLNNESLVSLTGLVNALLPILQSHQARATNLQIASNQVKVSALTGKVMKAAMMLLIAMSSLWVTAQSPFKPEPKLGKPVEVVSGNRNIMRAVLNPMDSIVQVFRFAVNIAPAGFTFDGVYHAAAGTEFGLQTQSYNYASQKYTVLHSYNIAWMPLVTGQPIKSIKDFSTIGLTYGFDKNLIKVGPFYNPQGAKLKNQLGVWAILGINLN